MPPNKGRSYPADPPTVEEIILVMRDAAWPERGPDTGLITSLWRAGLRISEALALTESDLDAETGSVLIRAARAADAEVGMDAWGWEHYSDPLVMPTWR